MANHVIPENPQISLELQKLRTTDRAHADIFNNINAKLIENDAYLEKEIRKVAKEGIQLTTDREFVNSLINNTAKAGSVLLFSNVGERNGNVTDESYTLYAGLMNCNRYSGCDITVKAIHMEEQSLHPMFFQSPNFFLAKVDKQNAKRVVIYPLGGGNVEELRERLDSVEEKANQAFTQAGEGKAKVVDAFTGLGISASSNETFKSLADKIKTKTLNKFKVANALTNKGVLTSTTATQEQIINTINNIELPIKIDITNLPYEAFRVQPVSHTVEEGTYHLPSVFNTLSANKIKQFGHGYGIYEESRRNFFVINAPIIIKKQRNYTILFDGLRVDQGNRYEEYTNIAALIFTQDKEVTNRKHPKDVIQIYATDVYGGAYGYGGTKFTVNLSQGTYYMILKNRLRGDGKMAFNAFYVL